MRVLNHPSTGPPPVYQSTSLLSKFRWWVPKQVSIVATFLVLGSYISIWRPLCSSGNACADGWLDPLRQKSGVGFGRMRAAIHTRPCASIEKLWAVVWLVQIASSFQYGDGWVGGLFAWLGVFGSRTSSFTCVTLLCPGVTTGM